MSCHSSINVAKRILIVLIAIAMIITMIPTTFVHGSTGSHVVKFMYADMEGNVDAEPYFEIEVPAGMSVEEAMEAEENWLSWPEAFGFYSNWREGTFNQDNGMVSFEEDSPWYDSFSVVEENKEYYLQWEAIETEGLEDYQLTMEASDHVEFANSDTLNGIGNQILADVANYRRNGEDTISGAASKSFLTESVSADRLEINFQLTEEHEEQENLLNSITVGLELCLYKEGEEEPFATEQVEETEANIEIVVNLGVPQENCIYYIAKVDENGDIIEIETEDGTELLLEYSWPEESGEAFFYNIRYMGQYDFGYEVDEEEPDIAEDVIMIEAAYFDETGEWIWEPLSITMDNVQEGTTYREVFEELLNPVKHYAEMGQFEWSIFENCYEDVDDVAEGGREFSAYAIYENVLVNTEIGYYTETGDKEFIYDKKVVKKGTTYGDIEESLRVYTEDLAQRSDFTGNWDSNYELDAVVDDHDPFDVFSLTAEYQSYNVELLCYYLDENEEPQFIKKVVEDVPGGTTVEELCNAELNKTLETEEEFSWAIHPQYEIGDGLISFKVDSIGAAVKTDKYSPFFVCRYTVEGSDGNYEPMQVEEVYYCEGDLCVSETEDGLFIDEEFENMVLEEVYQSSKDDNHAFDLTGYKKSYDAMCYQPEGYEMGLFYSLEAVYDKALVVLNWFDGQEEYVERVVVELDEEGVAEYVLPEKGNFRQFWDIGGPTYGGNFVMSGETITAVSPVIYAISKYRLSIEGLTEVPQQYGTVEEVKEKLGAEALADDTFDRKKVKFKYYNVEIFDYEGEKIRDGQFPQGGIEFYLPCPENINLLQYKFKVTHFITEEGHDKEGETESLRIVGTVEKDGKTYFKVIAYSLSPIALAYQNITEETPDENPSGTTGSGQDGTGSSDKNAPSSVVKTGDSTHIFLYVLLALAAAAATAFVYRKNRETEK